MAVANNCQDEEEKEVAPFNGSDLELSDLILTEGHPKRKDLKLKLSLRMTIYKYLPLFELRAKTSRLSRKDRDAHAVIFQVKNQDSTHEINLWNEDDRESYPHNNKVG